MSCVGVAWRCYAGELKGYDELREAKEMTSAEKQWHRMAKNSYGNELSGIAVEKL